MKKAKKTKRNNPYIIYTSELDENIIDKEAEIHLREIENENLIFNKNEEIEYFNDIPDESNNSDEYLKQNLKINYKKLAKQLSSILKEIPRSHIHKSKPNHRMIYPKDAKPNYPKKSDEIYIQSKLLLYIIANGFEAFVEVPTKFGIPDIIVYNSEKTPICIIETKSEGSINNSTSHQIAKYKRTGLPVILCNNLNQFSEIVKYLRTL